jgi:hypothetical protein
MAGLYMGPSSAFAGAFGPANPTPPLPGATGNKPGLPTGKIPVGPVGPIVRGPFREGDPKTPGAIGGPIWGGKPISTPTSLAANPAPLGSVLPSQAVRASGDSKGFDPAYLQNLATAIGGLFSGGKNGVMNLNPLGNLSEISGPSGQEGNAPQAGLPMTWLQQALNGLGFNFAPPAPPTVGTIGNRGGAGSVGGGGGNRGPRQYA